MCLRGFVGAVESSIFLLSIDHLICGGLLLVLSTEGLLVSVLLLSEFLFPKGIHYHLGFMWCCRLFVMDS
jgi:hypothetical protein